MEKTDVTALGELLIDFTQNGLSGQGNPLFEANPGGAPCNVLAMLSKLGHKTAFIGKVGDDFFGRMLRDSIKEVGIDDSGLIVDKVHTTLAFVHTAPDGDRDFSFYRNPGADMMLTRDEIPEELIKNSKIFHFGTLSMTHEGVRQATRAALETAKKAGVLISFDPNLRPPLWDDLETAKEQVLYGLDFCDILKISDNEIEWLTGISDFDAAVESIREKYNIPLILVSMGRDGSRAYYKKCGKIGNEMAADSGQTVNKTVTDSNNSGLETAADSINSGRETATDSIKGGREMVTDCGKGSLETVTGCGKGGLETTTGCGEIRVHADAFITENTVDTTGAGDTFFGCVLSYICKYGLDGLDESVLREMLQFANAAASIITTRKGALRMMPDEAQIREVLNRK